MVQEAATTGRRQRNRLERHQAFLRAAQALVAAEGLEALTMQRLAAEVDCAVGTAYTYFPSKSALVAEVQREAIDTLAESYARFADAYDAAIGAQPTTAEVVLVGRLLGFGRFCIAILDTFPEEARLLQLLMAERSRAIIDDSDVHRVIPAAFRLLAHAQTAFEAAADAGAVHPGDATERTVVLLAALNGVLMLDGLARVDAELFDGRRLGASTIEDLLAGWGADRAVLAHARERLDAMAARGPLAPRPKER